MMTGVTFLQSVERLQFRNEKRFLFGFEICERRTVGKGIYGVSANPLIDVLSHPFNGDEHAVEGIDLGLYTPGKSRTIVSDLSNSRNERLFADAVTIRRVCCVAAEHVSAQSEGIGTHVVV